MIETLVGLADEFLKEDFEHVREGKHIAGSTKQVIAIGLSTAGMPSRPKIEQRIKYEEHGRHEIFAGGKRVPLASTAHSLSLNMEDVQAGAQTDLDELGIPKNTREEKIKARSVGIRSQTLHAAENNGDSKRKEEIARLYRQQLVKTQTLVQIQRTSRVKTRT